MKKRKFELDGKELYFDKNVLNSLFKRRRFRESLSVEECERKLAEELECSASKIHSWRFGNSEPTTMNELKNLSEALGVEVMQLLKDSFMVNSDLKSSITVDQSDVCTIIIPRSMCAEELNSNIMLINNCLSGVV